MELKKELDLTADKMPYCIIILAFPVLAGNVFETAFHLINGIWVGSIGTTVMAAITATTYIQWLFYELINIVSIGTISLVGQLVGAKRMQDAARVAQQGIGLSFSLAVFISLFIFFSGEPILKYMGLKADVIGPAMVYVRYMAFVLPLLALNEVMCVILRAYGDTKTPYIILSAGYTFNIIMDYVLIFVFKMGITGVALGLLLNNLLMFSIFLYLMLKKKLPFTVGREILTLDSKVIKEVVKIGFPVSISALVFTFVSIFVLKLVTASGTEATAAFGIGQRIENFSYIITYAICIATVTIAAQNIGAMRYDRAVEGAQVGIKLVTIISLLNIFFFLIFPEQLVSIFTKDPKVIPLAVNYLRIIAVSQIFINITIILEGVFRGAGDTIPPTVISIPTVAARLPLACLFTAGMGLSGIWLGITLSAVIRSLVTIFWFNKGKWKEKKILEKILKQ